MYVLGNSRIKRDSMTHMTEYMLIGNPPTFGGWMAHTRHWTYLVHHRRAYLLAGMVDGILSSRILPEGKVELNARVIVNAGCRCTYRRP